MTRGPQYVEALDVDALDSPPPPLSAFGGASMDVLPQHTDAMEDVASRPERLIGYSGKGKLKDRLKPIEDPEAAIDFIRAFQQVHSLRGNSIAKILAFFEMGKYSQDRVARGALRILTEYFKRKIPELSQDQLTELLDKSYSFLTIPEMRPIAISVLDRLDNVDETTWSQIVHNGLDESPYIDMPLSIKRRIWISCPQAFEHEVEQLMKCIKDYSEPTDFESFLAQDARAKQRAENKLLQQFLRLISGVDDMLVVALIDKMVDAAAEVQFTPKRLAFANMFHDILVLSTARNMPNVEKLRKMARHLDRGGQNKELDLSQIRDIRDGLSESASCGPVALLVSSVYSRDLITEQLILKLLQLRKRLPKSDDGSAIERAADDLRRNPWLENLTYMCVCNIKSQRLLSENKPLEEMETAQYYTEFFPQLGNEIALDDYQMADDYYQCNASLPHEDLVHAARRGPFERRILAGYGLFLMSRGNLVGLSKMRLILDTALRSCNTEEEAREVAVCVGLIGKILDS